MPGLVVNGETVELSEEEFPETVGDLIRARGLEARAVVAEVDGEIVPRDRFDTHPLAPGGRVELVQFVGGG